MWIALLLDLRLGGIIDVMEQNTNGNKTTTLDDLALMIGKGFNEVHEKFDKVDERFDGLEGRMDKLDKKKLSKNRYPMWNMEKQNKLYPNFTESRR